jgi:hypothetical protein
VELNFNNAHSREGDWSLALSASKLPSVVMVVVVVVMIVVPFDYY